MYADENVIKIKHDVLYEVAKLAFAGELDEKRDNIAMSLIPGPTPQFRCCIYKEREIIRQRVRLAEGKAPGLTDDGNVIQVISSACEDCPISSYIVTENCQNCLGKACINACKFGAIEPGRTRSHIDPTKCKECGRPGFGMSKGGGEIPWYVHELPVIVIGCGQPFVLADIPQARTYINTYDSADQTFDALIEKLMSGSDAFIGEDPVDAYCGLWDTHR